MSAAPRKCERERVQVYLPHKEECMPDKREVFMRVRARYANEIREYTELMQRFNQIFLDALEVIEPRVWSTTIPIAELPEELTPNVFEGAKNVTLFVSTLGSSMDAMITELLNGEKTFDAFVADAWASEAIEALNNNFDEKLHREFGKGTMRFSPGYGDIDIRMNRFIVDLLKADIEVLESGVMIPRKTTACMIGWYGDKDRKREQYETE